MAKHYQTYTDSGVDVASNRADDLDRLCLAEVAGLYKPTVLDLGCGLGGQSLRLAEAGAVVTAIDNFDFTEKFAGYQELNYVSESNLHFIQADIRDLEIVLGDNKKYSLAIVQRTLHYLPYQDTERLLNYLRQVVDGQLYLSVMNLDSEAGVGYGGGVSVENRFACISEVNKTKYSIFKPVCLYRQIEFEKLLKDCGWNIEKIWQSAFGNIKVVATKTPS